MASSKKKITENKTVSVDEVVNWIEELRKKYEGVKGDGSHILARAIFEIKKRSGTHG